MFTTMQFQVIHWLWCLLGGDTKIQNNDLGEFLTIQFCKQDAMGGGYENTKTTISVNIQQRFLYNKALNCENSQSEGGHEVEGGGARKYKNNELERNITPYTTK